MNVKTKDFVGEHNMEHMIKYVIKHDSAIGVDETMNELSEIALARPQPEGHVE